MRVAHMNLNAPVPAKIGLGLASGRCRATLHCRVGQSKNAQADTGNKPGRKLLKHSFHPNCGSKAKTQEICMRRKPSD